MHKFKSTLCYLAPPFITAFILLFVFWIKGLFPFGELSITWCDMTQQTIPLLIDFKDILEGNGSIFLNMNNAAGMNFYGVFFFFLSSPFSFLVKFVPKGDMALFVNILTVIKLSLSGFTGFLFFRKRRKTLSDGICIFLGISYALCGYGMLFYQNLMWLDVMYLFPLLLISLEMILENRSNIPYILSLSAIITVNYYISFMVAIFVLLFAGVYLLILKGREICRKAAVSLAVGTLISGLITGVVWLPSLLQVSSSGRGESVTETLLDSGFLTSYQTVLPLLFCSAFIFAVIIINIFLGAKRTKVFNGYFALFFLTLIPFFVEPINIMWHTGNYMSFPARYGFITVFTGLICCAELLKNGMHQSKTNVFALVLAILSTGFYGLWTVNYVNKNIGELSAYTDNLWGNGTSFDALSRMFFISVICYGMVYLLFRYKKLAVRSFTVLAVIILSVESYGNIRVYMTSYPERYPYAAHNLKSITDLADKIEDDGFFRVATDRKITDYNTVGALGYPTLSHYTSLTDKNYMFTQKKLGYTSVWMEVSAHGGTEFTNALYGVKYKIKEGNEENSVFSTNRYSIVKEPISHNLGIVIDKDLSAFKEIPEDLTRAEVQQYIFSALYGDEKLITEYEFDSLNSTGIDELNGKYFLRSNANINYKVSVLGRQSLYADCFDRLSNDLSEEYFDSLTVYVNGIKIADKYPSATENGLLSLGTFENTDVEISFVSNKAIGCYSFGVFGLDTKVLEKAVNSTDTADLKYRNNKIYGNFTSGGENNCILSLPYNKGFRVKVNGKNTEYSKVFSDFTAFKLENGENKIEITFVPTGFYLGLLLSVSGIITLILYIIFCKKIRLCKIAESVIAYISYTVIIFATLTVMFFPILIFLLKYI